MRTQLTQRLRSASTPVLSSVPPLPTSTEYSRNLANLATRILYRSPLPSQNHLPVFILNAAALPDVDYDALLPYVLSRLPDEEELIGGHGYEIVFFAGGKSNGAATTKKNRPGWGWFLQAYHLLTRATRKRLQRLYIVHEKNWIRLLFGTFSTIVSPKFNKKVVHVSTISQLALHIPIENLLIPPSAYLVDRRLSSEIYAPYSSGKRAFAIREPIPASVTGSLRLPRILREATSFLVADPPIKTSGLFRINARALEVEILKEAYDRGQKFIVWNEGDMYQASAHRREGSGDVWVDDIQQAEGFGIHTAAGLIKYWYRDLRIPLLPQSSYAPLQKYYGDAELSLEPSDLLKMLSQEAEWSVWPKLSRKIMTMHLLPMLSRVLDFKDWNQMTPYNISVCFAPLMLCGPDPMEDFKMTSITRKLLEAMLTSWKADLAPHFSNGPLEFEESLRLPEAVEDREDPLQELQATRASEDAQTSGIVLVDSDSSEGDFEDRPPLPPRRQDTMRDNSPTSGANCVRRKPAPPLQTPPRYSSIIDRSYTAPPAGFTNSVPLDDDMEDEDGQEASVLPAYETMLSPATSSTPNLIARKPLPKSADSP